MKKGNFLMMNIIISRYEGIKVSNEDTFCNKPFFLLPTEMIASSSCFIFVELVEVIPYSKPLLLVTFQHIIQCNKYILWLLNYFRCIILQSKLNYEHKLLLILYISLYLVQFYYQMINLIQQIVQFITVNSMQA